MMMPQQVIGTFSRKSGFTIVKLSLERKRDLKYIGKNAANKQEYDEMTIDQVMCEITEDLKEEFEKDIKLELTTARSGRVYAVS